MRFDPPTHQAAMAHAEWFFVVFMSLTTAGVLIWAARRREWVLFVLLPAAALSSFIEPIYDEVGVAWWSKDMLTAFTLFHGHIFCPTIFPLGYVMWVGLGTYFSYFIFAQRWERRKVVRTFVILALAEPALEYPWLGTRLFSYHGPQAYKLLGYAITWNAVNTAGVAVTGAAMLWMRDSGLLEGRGIRRVALLPFVMIGVYFIVGAPSWFVMHIDHVSDAVIWIGGTITLIVGHHITVMGIDFATHWNARRAATSAAYEHAPPAPEIAPTTLAGQLAVTLSSPSVVSAPGTQP